MATELICAGVVKTMLEDVVYAIPARLCSYTVITAGGTIEVSNDGSTWQAITLDANANFVTSAPFIRVVDDDAQIIGKTS